MTLSLHAKANKGLRQFSATQTNSTSIIMIYIIPKFHWFQQKGLRSKLCKCCIIQWLQSKKITDFNLSYIDWLSILTPSKSKTCFFYRFILCYVWSGSQNSPSSDSSSYRQENWNPDRFGSLLKVSLMSSGPVLSPT